MNNHPRWLYWLALAIICLAIYTIADSTFNQIDYNREMIGNGEYWRLITGNFNHTNAIHLLLNLLALAIIAGLHHSYYNAISFTCLIMYLSISVGAAIYYWSPSTQLYVGLSGVLHGLIMVGAIIDSYKREFTGYLLVLGTLAKVIDEQFSSASTAMSALIQAKVLTDAHLYGLIAGLLIAPIYVYLNKKKSAIAPSIND